ncbi:C-terminal binding protein [Microbaculum marinisediminis]|uniref:C-terminal binding protein n=1 Tax=Microbaculum marinisediminis TaxID=2931392 RepID=A0AAW5R1A9_9HYPH|nr:C-terminal binding protein [Microbaculum sp. A6E488]MCT8973102.1 C-terminal binding protein [Microbaculum sp. A6E488]
MPTRTVAVLEPGYATYDTERTILSEQDVRVVPVGVGSDAVSALRELDPVAVMVRERPVTAAEFGSCPSLKVVVRYGVGVDNIDLDCASRRGIYVANIPDYGADNEVSEHALALYLSVQRRIPGRDRDVRLGKWGIGQSETIPSRENATLGLIGCGRIGLATAGKFRALGFGRVLAFDPYLSAERAASADVDLVDLDTLCRLADVVSLHAPLTEDTRHILDGGKIALMKPQSIVVNVSRGGLVDEAALAAALHEGRIFGAGIDVFESEPVSPDNPLLSAPNTVITDHTAWYSERSVAVLQTNAASEVKRVLTGEPPMSWVNRW